MKYFVVSDIHSHSRQLKYALSMKGYDKDNPNHTLIVLGDIFDRGPDPVGVYEFLTSIPKSRRILIRGNHEDIYESLLHEIPNWTDFANGTVGTFCKIAGFDLKKFIGGGSGIHYEYWDEILDKVKKSKITKFIQSKEWRNFYEVGGYIFVHGFIPTNSDFGSLSYLDNWRETANEDEWMNARWTYAYRYINTDVYKPERDNNKTLVVGHVNCSDVRQFLERTNEVDYDIYYGDHFISIDACTVVSKKVNVLVLETKENSK